MQLRASLIPQQVRNGRAGLHDNARRFPSPPDIRVPLPCEYGEGEARFENFGGEDGGGGVVQDRGACGPAETCQYRDGRVLYAQQDEGESATRDGGGSAVDPHQRSAETSRSTASWLEDSRVDCACF